MTRVSDRGLSPAEWAVLGLLCAAPSHGWTLAKELGREGQLGKIWTVNRPLVYRALDLVEQRGLIERIGLEPGTRGPSRVIYGPTRPGRDAIAAWLGEPVAHIRDMRPLFLLKVVLAERAGVVPPPIIARQREAFAELVESLESELAGAQAGDELVVRFRLESTRGALRFVESLRPSGG